MKKIFIFLFLILSFSCFCFAQTTPAQLQRSQEILEEERTLRGKLEKEEKVYIKKIMVKGATLLNAKQIREIILPFQKHWLTKDDIQQILALIERSYINNGYVTKLKGISYQVKKRILEIQIEER
jgi:hemolysin activation/secretion protein